MAYNDYGAMVWCDGVLMNKTNADSTLFGDELDGLCGDAVYANLFKYGGKTDDVTRCYHAVLGDGDVRVGIHKGYWLYVANRDGVIGGCSIVDEDEFVKTFNVPRKHVVGEMGYDGKTHDALFTKEWLSYHHANRKMVKSMRNRFGGRHAWLGKDCIRLHSKHQRDFARKQLKRSSINPSRVPKGKVLLPDGAWFTANIGGININVGFDEAMTPRTTYIYDNKGKTERTSYVHDKLLRVAVELDGHMWACRAGACYGNGWESDGHWPERMYDEVIAP